MNIAIPRSSDTVVVHENTLAVNAHSVTAQLLRSWNFISIFMQKDRATGGGREAGERRTADGIGIIAQICDSR